uniref:Uncharacterized protein n=1 Tax=Ascaris lumbricoides TaxID=6252 RepID=A0A0M3I9Y9_ASCLU
MCRSSTLTPQPNVEVDDTCGLKGSRKSRNSLMMTTWRESQLNRCSDSTILVVDSFLCRVETPPMMPEPHASAYTTTLLLPSLPPSSHDWRRTMNDVPLRSSLYSPLATLATFAA